METYTEVYKIQEDVSTTRRIYLANRFMLSAASDNSTKYFLGIRPLYKKGEPHKKHLAVLTDGKNNFAIGEKPGEIGFELTNIADFDIAVVMEHEGHKVANIALRPGEKYIMNNQNATTEDSTSNKYSFHAFPRSGHNFLNGNFTTEDFIYVETPATPPPPRYGRYHPARNEYFESILGPRKQERTEEIEEWRPSADAFSDVLGPAEQHLADEPESMPEFDYDNPVSISVIVRANESIKFVNWEKLKEKLRKEVISEYLAKDLGEKPAKTYKVEEYCVICYDAVPTITTSVCGHTCMCLDCAYAINICPLCRCAISARITTVVNEKADEKPKYTGYYNVDDF